MIDIFKKKKVIIFDLDGTLIDSINIWNEVDEKAVMTLSDNKIHPKNIGEFRDEVLANCSSSDIYLEYCEALKNKYNLEQTPKEILDFRWDLSDYYVKNKIDYNENADKVLKYLKEKGYVLALATTTTNIQLNAYLNYNQNIIQKAKLDDIFSIILSKDDVLNKKPNPEVHLKIMDILKVSCEDCLIIEDSLVGVEAACNAGIDVITVYEKNSLKDKEKIDKISKKMFYNFDELLDYIKMEIY